jgi:hypothetical protein
MPANPWEYFWPGVIAAQTIHVAAKLGIADMLAAGPKTAAELAAQSGAHPATLERLLRALATLEMFAPTADGRFSNTPLSEELRSDRPNSQRFNAMFLPAPFLWRPLGELYESVRSGEPAFEKIFGEPFFDYLASHPADGALFNSVMSQGHPWAPAALLAAYDFSCFERVVDVGGGQGALLREILTATPQIHGVLFDLPTVVAGASAILTGELAGRCEIVGGSFFDAVPEGPGVYLLNRVIHDWTDEDAVRILRNTHRAMRPDGTLILIESFADSAGRPSGLMEMLMLVVGGRERTEAEFRTLLEGAGFTIARIAPTESSALIECHPLPARDGH